MSMISEDLFKLFQGTETVTSLAAQAPNEPIYTVAAKLYPSSTHEKLHKLAEKLHIRQEKEKKDMNDEITQTDLERAAQCGKFRRPSDLFLKAGGPITSNTASNNTSLVPFQIFLRALLTLENHPLDGMVSPPLLGSMGVIPLTIISVIPDIIRHYADVIVRAESEIFFATNFWETSSAATTICDAFKELSRRTGAQDPNKKVVIKLIYDRGNPKQVLDAHQFVDEKEYTGDRVKLPHPSEIPNIDLQVVNYHQVVVGTFHAKYMVVDRKIALLNSNNIQDRVNVEMMTHIEGPIVQSFYDMALLSWHNEMNIPLPLLLDPPAAQTEFAFGSEHKDIQKKDLEASKIDSRKYLAEQQEMANKQQNPAVEYDEDDYAEKSNVEKTLTTADGINSHLNTGTKIAPTTTSSPSDREFTPHILHTRHDPVPMALVNRKAFGKPVDHGDTYNPQDQAFLAGFKYAQKKVFIQTPTFNAPPVVEAALEAVKRGIEVEIFVDLGFNDEGELLPKQGGTNLMVVTSMYQKLSTDEEKARLKIYWYTGKDQVKPLNASDKSRNCHVKLMIIDECVGIQGNGNQDAQSWFHSQEINVLVDSASICREWYEGILNNQNTKQYGLVGADGVWRGEDGSTLKGGVDPPSGPFKSLKGVTGAIQRVRGEGGF